MRKYVMKLPSIFLAAVMIFALAGQAAEARDHDGWRKRVITTGIAACTVGGIIIANTISPKQQKCMEPEPSL